MEVKINNSIDIQPTVKKKRPRIASNANKLEDDNTTVYVKPAKADDVKKEKKHEKRSNDKKFKKFNYKKPERSVDDIKEGIKKSLESTGGKYVKFDDINHTEGLLVCGIVDASNTTDKVTAADICFAVVNHDRKLIYVNCNERFSVMREPSMKCSILDWLYRNETATINDIANGAMEYDGVEIFTDVYLNEPVEPKPKQNKSKKNKSAKKSNKKA